MNLCPSTGNLDRLELKGSYEEYMMARRLVSHTHKQNNQKRKEVEVDIYWVSSGGKWVVLLV